jgi:hypothetical protein
MTKEILCPECCGDIEVEESIQCPNCKTKFKLIIDIDHDGERFVDKSHLQKID